MRHILHIIGITLVFLPSVVYGQDAKLVEPAYYELPLGAVVPAGWLRHQLTIMREGSTGHLDEIHPKLAQSNGWLGGTGDGWEKRRIG